MQATSLLRSLPLNNTTIFLRADLNVPIKDGKILNDYRLYAIKKTLSFLLEHHATVILATHIGRPQNQDPDLSTRYLLPWFTQHGYTIFFAEHLEQVPSLIKEHKGAIILLENLRFYPGEQDHDPYFAHQLARGADYYVNDAFATLHRTDTSITLLPELFAPEKRSIGFLVEDELQHLHRLIESPARPFSLILGGGKIDTKIPLLNNLMPHIDNLLLCPAIVCSFLKAMGKPVGLSLVDDTALATCTALLDTARTHNINVLFPLDYHIAHGSFTGPLSYADADQFPSDGIAISIGPKTYEYFGAVIRKSKTIFYNGLMGTVSRKETLDGMNAILNAMADSSGYSVVGGGDSVAATQILGHADDIDYLSTGGGATLSYLSGAPLPGLRPFVS
jgi:phosphoglycerate kinase